jgi:hypothetical protein
MAASADPDRPGVVGAALAPGAARSMQHVLDRLWDERHVRTLSEAVLSSWRRSAACGVIPDSIRAPGTVALADPVILSPEIVRPSRR